MVDGQADKGAEHAAQWIEADDGCRLFVRRWKPDSPSRGILHIVHGMGEHSLRYARPAWRLCEAGIEVWAADQRGHGKTATEGGNDPGKGGRLGHCADRDGYSRVTADLDLINRTIQGENPGLPLFMLGHSWGSFITQNYIETYGGVTGPTKLAGCILSGTRGPDGVKIAFGARFMDCLARLRGSRAGSLLARAIADGPYNKPFRPNRTAVDWLSRDEKEVDAYVADPLCGQLCSAGFYRDLLALLNRIHRPEAMEGIRRDLPIYVFSGSADPVGDMGNSPTALVQSYRAFGVPDLEFVLYPDARHEPLNETNREEVTENLLSWLTRHISPGISQSGT